VFAHGIEISHKKRLSAVPDEDYSLPFELTPCPLVATTDSKGNFINAANVDIHFNDWVLIENTGVGNLVLFSWNGSVSLLPHEPNAKFCCRHPVIGFAEKSFSPQTHTVI
jgi:hypothetical protein